MKIEYKLTTEQEQKFKAWYREQDKKAAKDQLAKIESGEYTPLSLEFVRPMLEAGHPYAGCIGVGPTWTITETSVAPTLHVKHWYTNEELDLSDYENW